MRIWHSDLIPCLCRQHLLAVWREGLGCWKILTEDKKGYRNHPAVKEFEDSPWDLHIRMSEIRQEMLKRGYHPKPLPYTPCKHGEVKEWESLETQIQKLKAKGCKCKV